MVDESDSYKTPGQLIEALLKERRWTKRALAIVLDVSDAAVTRITKDKQPVGAHLAVVLEEVFGVEAERFMSLQQSFDLAQARFMTRPDPGRATRAALFGDLPIADMIKRGWLRANNSRDTEAVESGLIRFFGVNRAEDIEVLPHAAKKTDANCTATAPQLAWLYRVRHIASDMLVPPYNTAKAKRAISDSRALLKSAEGAAKIPRILADCGIRFVICETLPAAKIDGVCFWLDEKSPVIGMSLRFDRIDNFWFVLRHEAEHVFRRHGVVEAMLDTDLVGQKAGIGADIAEEERQANLAAQEFCVPKKMMDAFVARKAPLFSERDMKGFAKVVGVHPGIVAGQLQRITDRYDRFRTHQVKVRSIVCPNAVSDGWGDVIPIDGQ